LVPKNFANCSEVLKPDLKNGAVILRRIFFAIAYAFTLSYCGTAQDVMNGAGAVLDGMGNGASSLGSILD